MVRRTLWVTGFNEDVRARDLGHEFERFGPIVRCDIPVPRSNRPRYAFVEFEYDRDAEDAKYEMDRRRYKGDMLEVVFARSDKSRRMERQSRPRSRERRRSAERFGRSDRDRRGPREYRSRDGNNGRYNEESPNRDEKRGSPPPPGQRRRYSRSPSPEFARGRTRSRSASPSSVNNYGARDVDASGRRDERRSKSPTPLDN